MFYQLQRCTRNLKKVKKKNLSIFRRTRSVTPVSFGQSWCDDSTPEKTFPASRFLSWLLMNQLALGLLLTLLHGRPLRHYHLPVTSRYVRGIFDIPFLSCGGGVTREIINMSSVWVLRRAWRKEGGVGWFAIVYRNRRDREREGGIK